MSIKNNLRALGVFWAVARNKKRFIKNQHGAVHSKNMAQRTQVCKGHLNEQRDSGMEFRPSNSTPDWLCHVAKTTHVSEAQRRDASYRAFMRLVGKRFTDTNLSTWIP